MLSLIGEPDPVSRNFPPRANLSFVRFDKHSRSSRELNLRRGTGAWHKKETKYEVKKRNSRLGPQAVQPLPAGGRQQEGRRARNDALARDALLWLLCALSQVFRIPVDEKLVTGQLSPPYDLESVARRRIAGFVRALEGAGGREAEDTYGAFRSSACSGFKRAASVWSRCRPRKSRLPGPGGTGPAARLCIRYRRRPCGLLRTGRVRPRHPAAGRVRIALRWDPALLVSALQRESSARANNRATSGTDS